MVEQLSGAAIAHQAAIEHMGAAAGLRVAAGGQLDAAGHGWGAVDGSSDVDGWGAVHGRGAVDGWGAEPSWAYAGIPEGAAAKGPLKQPPWQIDPCPDCCDSECWGLESACCLTADDLSQYPVHWKSAAKLC